MNQYHELSVLKHSQNLYLFCSSHSMIKNNHEKCIADIKTLPYLLKSSSQTDKDTCFIFNLIQTNLKNKYFVNLRNWNEFQFIVNTSCLLSIVPLTVIYFHKLIRYVGHHFLWINTCPIWAKSIGQLLMASSAILIALLPDISKFIRDCKQLQAPGSSQGFFIIYLVILPLLLTKQSNSKW